MGPSRYFVDEVVDDRFQVPTYYIPLYFQFVRGDSALTAAVRLLPFIILMVTFGFLNGGLMSKLGYYMPWYLTGGILTTIGGALMSAYNIIRILKSNTLTH